MCVCVCMCTCEHIHVCSPIHRYLAVISVLYLLLVWEGVCKSLRRVPLVGPITSSLGKHIPHGQYQGLFLGEHLYISFWQHKFRGSSGMVLFNQLMPTIGIYILLRRNFPLGHSSECQGIHKQLFEKGKRAKVRVSCLKLHIRRRKT